MNVRIRAARDAGDLERERLVLEVAAPTDIGHYGVFDTTFTDDGGVSNLLRHAYWFPDKKVKAGDLVILYTKTGSPNEKVSASGVNSHFFYWGLNRTVWNNEGDCAVLLRVAEWTYTAVSPAKEVEP